MRARLHQLLRQRPVIRHQEQSLARVIQPPHRIHALSTLRQQIHHRRPSLRIAHRGHISLRLVQQQKPQPLPLLQRLSIHAYRISLRIGLRSLFRHPATRHSPLFSIRLLPSPQPSRISPPPLPPPSAAPFPRASSSRPDAPRETARSAFLLFSFLATRHSPLATSLSPAFSFHTNNSPPAFASHPAAAVFSSARQSLFPAAPTPPASAYLSLLQC